MQYTQFKGIVSDSNSIFLLHESEDINKKAYFQNLSWFQIYVYNLCMIVCIGIAPYTTVLDKSRQKNGSIS